MPRNFNRNNRAAFVIVAAVIALGAVATVLLRRTETKRVVQTSQSATPDRIAFAAYAGSQSCRDCHPNAFNAWRDSHHGLAERGFLASDAQAFQPARNIKHGTQVSEVKMEGNQFELIAAGRENPHATFTLDRVIGVDPLIQFLVPEKGGRFQVSELAFDPRKHQWFDIFGNEDRKPGEWGHWTGRGMTWNQMCASCHNTRLRKHYDPANDSYATTMVERGVGCESCHGPMANHVSWQKNHSPPAKGDPTIRKLDHAQTMATCGSCHARRSDITGEFTPGESFNDHFLLTIPDESDLYFADGQVREENYEYTSFLSSKMFAAGVWCMDCHEPHGAKVKAQDNSLCMRCHGTPLPPAPKIVEATHTFHAAGKAGSRCVDCHMPQTIYMQRHARRDHGFTIPDPLLTQQFGIPNACNRCHADKDAAWSLSFVEKWYGERMDRPSRARAQSIAKGRRGETNAVPELIRLSREEKIGVWRASATRLLGEFVSLPGVERALLDCTGDQNPLVRANAAHALGSLAHAGSSGALTSEQKLLADSARAVRVEAAWALHATLDTNSPAGRELMASLAFNCDQPAGAAQLGALWLARGDAAAALPWFEKAVTWDTHSAPLRDSLAVCYSTLGRVADAVRELEIACTNAPRDAQLAYRLALALNEAGRLTDAITALEKSVKLEPQFAPEWYNLGIGYAQAGRDDDAIAAPMRAELLDSTSPRAAYARATVLAKLGRVEEAQRAARRALEIRRDFPEAEALLQTLEGQ
jgi:predicted CXXCH cytochrome family protein